MRFAGGGGGEELDRESSASDDADRDSAETSEFDAVGVGEGSRCSIEGAGSGSW